MNTRKSLSRAATESHLLKMVQKMVQALSPQLALTGNTLQENLKVPLSVEDLPNSLSYLGCILKITCVHCTFPYFLLTTQGSGTNYRMCILGLHKTSYGMLRGEIIGDQDGMGKEQARENEGVRGQKVICKQITGQCTSLAMPCGICELYTCASCEFMLSPIAAWSWGHGAAAASPLDSATPGTIYAYNNSLRFYTVSAHSSQVL